MLSPSPDQEPVNVAPDSISPTADHVEVSNDIPWQVAILQDGLFPEPLEPVEVFQPGVQEAVDLIDQITGVERRDHEPVTTDGVQLAAADYEHVPLGDMGDEIGVWSYAQNADPDTFTPDRYQQPHYPWVYSRAKVSLLRANDTTTIFESGPLVQDGWEEVTILVDGRLMASYDVAEESERHRILGPEEADSFLNMLNGILTMHVENQGAAQHTAIEE